MYEIELRDFLASQVMSGDWACQDEEDFGVWGDNTKKEILEDRARLYYRMADAMLKVRAE